MLNPNGTQTVVGTENVNPTSSTENVQVVNSVGAEIAPTRQVDTAKILTYLERLGLTNEDLTSDDFNENTFINKILSNDSFTLDHNKQVTIKHDTFLTDKLKKTLSTLTGIEETEMAEETDFKKLVIKSIEKLKTNGNNNIDSISLEYRTKELDYQAQLETLKNQLDVEKGKMTNELKDYKVNMKVNSFVDSSNLTSVAKANQTEITNAALHVIKSKFDVKEKDGVLVLYNGSQPLYKEGTSKPTLLEDELLNYLSRNGYLKVQEEVKTLTGNGQPTRTSNMSTTGKFRYKR
jgi:vacuolar-type H+-ATPase subunit I/STV1